MPAFTEPTPDPDPRDESARLWARHTAGDRRALEVLGARDIDWILLEVRARLGRNLRSVLESGDIVQMTLERFLRSCRKGQFEGVSDRDALRGLLAIMVRRSISLAHRYHRCLRRATAMDAARCVPWEHPEAVDMASGEGDPVQAAASAEQAQWVEWARALLPPKLQIVLILHDDRELGYDEVARLLEINVHAARKRRARAIQRVAEIVDLLQRRHLAELRRRIEDTDD